MGFLLTSSIQHREQHPIVQQYNTPPAPATPSPSPAHPNSHLAPPNALEFPTSNKETRSTKHDEIRLARRFLEKNNNNNSSNSNSNSNSNNPPTGQETHFELESLPSSWTSSNNTTTSQNQAQTTIDSQNPHSKTPSIFSAFASQDQQQQRHLLNDNNPEWPIDDLELNNHNHSDNHETQIIPRRHAAYLAAQADSYDAWADVGLVSAGDNHCVEEVEL